MRIFSSSSKQQIKCYCIAFSPNYSVLCHISSIDKPLPLEVMGGTTPTKIVDKIFDVLSDKNDFVTPKTVIKKDILLDEYKQGNVFLAPFYEKSINKK